MVCRSISLVFEALISSLSAAFHLGCHACTKDSQHGLCHLTVNPTQPLVQSILYAVLLLALAPKLQESHMYANVNKPINWQTADPQLGVQARL